ncbi:hypothetical protein GGQ85_003718 [Nitrobacter vulgaris]|nr:hypothetical protein [Nitrobacter vulgaris]
MGLLIDGKWHDQWYDTAASGALSVAKVNSVTGLPPTARPVPAERADSRRRRAAIISMSASPVLGRTALSSCASSRDWKT